MLDEATLKFFEKHGKAPPTVDRHGTEQDIANNMKRLLPRSWKLFGNELVGMTDVGELRQTIPTDYILDKVEDGLPVFRRVVVQ